MTAVINILSAGAALETWGACSVSATPINFGSYNVFSAAPLNASGTVTVQCDERPHPRATASIGPSPRSGSFDPRQMKHLTGPDLLNYTLYTNSTRTNIWGDGSGNTFTQNAKVKHKKPTVWTVYGRIPPLQDVSAGNYSDTLTVTITW